VLRNLGEDVLEHFLGGGGFPVRGNVPGLDLDPLDVGGQLGQCVAAGPTGPPRAVTIADGHATSTCPGILGRKTGFLAATTLDLGRG
jgi:hypothetical protein